MKRSKVIFAYKFYGREVFLNRLAAYMQRYKSPGMRAMRWESIRKEIMDWERNLKNIQMRRLFELSSIDSLYSKKK